MIGSGIIADAVATYLAAGMPAKLNDLRNRPDVPIDPRVCPDPREVLAYEPDSAGIDQLPAVYVIEIESEVVPIATEAAGHLFRSVNRLFVITSVMGRNMQETAQNRRLYALAVRELLLERPGFAPNMRVITKGLKEAHSEVERISDRALFQQCRTTILVSAEEALRTTAVVATPPAETTLNFEVIT